MACPDHCLIFPPKRPFLRNGRRRKGSRASRQNVEATAQPASAGTGLEPVSKETPPGLFDRWKLNKGIVLKLGCDRSPSTFTGQTLLTFIFCGCRASSLRDCFRRDGQQDDRPPVAFSRFSCQDWPGPRRGRRKRPDFADRCRLSTAQPF